MMECPLTFYLTFGLLVLLSQRCCVKSADRQDRWVWPSRNNSPYLQSPLLQTRYQVFEPPAEELSVSSAYRPSGGSSNYDYYNHSPPQIQYPQNNYNNYPYSVGVQRPPLPPQQAFGGQRPSETTECRCTERFNCVGEAFTACDKGKVICCKFGSEDEESSEDIVHDSRLGVLAGPNFNKYPPYYQNRRDS